MKTPITRLVLQSLCFLIFSSFLGSKTQAQDKSAFTANWPEWRGLYNSGAVSSGNTPVEFSETKNLKWKIEIPGKGHATPIIWGNQIIVQTAVPTDKKVEKTTDAAAPANPMSPTQTDFIHHKGYLFAVARDNAVVDPSTQHVHRLCLDS